MNSSLALLLLLASIQGCVSFTVPPPQVTTPLSRRIALSNSFDVTATTELRSNVDFNESAEGTSVQERNTLFLGNLPFDLNENSVREMCNPFGTVLVVNVPKNRETGQPRGFAFVDMSTAEELKDVVRGLDGTEINGRNIRASISDPTQKRSPEKQEWKPRTYENNNSNNSYNNRDQQRNRGGSKIYVGNLPFGTTKEALMGFYKQYCDPIEAYLPVDEETGRGRGFAFVTLQEQDVDSVIDQTNGQDFDGRNLVVNRPLPPRTNNSGNNRRSFGRRD